MPNLKHLDVLRIIHKVDVRVIIIYKNDIGGCKIVDEPYHGRYRPIDSDTCFEVKSELILAVKSSFYHAVIDDLFVSAYLGSRTAGKEDNIPVFLSKMLKERERLFKTPYL